MQTAPAADSYWDPATASFRRTPSDDGSSQRSQQPMTPHRVHISDFLSMCGGPHGAAAAPAAAVVCPAKAKKTRGRARPHLTDFMRQQQPPPATPPQLDAAGLRSPVPPRLDGSRQCREPVQPLNLCSSSDRSGSGYAAPPHGTPQHGYRWTADARSTSATSDGSARRGPVWAGASQSVRSSTHASVGPSEDSVSVSTRSVGARCDADVPPSPAPHISPLSLGPASSPCQDPRPARFQHDPYRVADPEEPQLPPVAPVLRAARPVLSSTPTVATVQFKYGRQGDFHVPAGMGVSVGQHCIVEGDRGEDMGMIVATRITAPADDEDRLILKLLRQATPEQADFWRNDLSQEEREAEPRAQEVVDQHSVDMTILHAEWQFDRKKLTFHFASKEPHPDFRRCLGACHSIWKCRIWFARYDRQSQDDENRRMMTGTKRAAAPRTTPPATLYSPDPRT